MSEPKDVHPPEVAAEEFIIGSRTDLLRALDLSRPELAGVRAALDAGDIAAAERAFIAHFRRRDMRSPLLPDWDGMPRDPQRRIKVADDCLAGRLMDDYNVHDVPPTGLDWHEAPLACLTRFPIFPHLLEAAHHSGDARYLRFLIDHGLDYLSAWPIESFVGQRSDRGWRHHYVVSPPWWWCMLPERLEEWARALVVVRQWEEVSDQELLAILHRMMEEIRFLMTQMPYWVEHRHNCGGYMIRVIGILACVLGDFREAAEWRRRDAGWLAEYLDDGFYPDGLYKELTLGYSSSVVAQEFRIAYALREEPAIAARRDALLRMATAMIGLAMPTGRIPSFGDALGRPLARVLYRPLMAWLNKSWLNALLAAGVGEPEVGDSRTVERSAVTFEPWFKERAEDEEPEPPFRHWPMPLRRREEQGTEWEDWEPVWGGYYVMRSDWSKRANYLMIDGGPWGTTHQHMDRLSFVLTAGGADFIIDPGNTRYASNEPDARLSTLHAGFLHNTITVDGVDEFVADIAEWEARRPLSNRWEQGQGYVLFEGEYSFEPAKPVVWRRRVVFVDDAYWLLHDTLTGELDEAEIEQNFQFGPDIRLEVGEEQVLATAANGARLVVKPLMTELRPGVVIGEETPQMTYSTQYATNTAPQTFPHGRGWFSPVTNKIMPAPALVFTGRVKLPAAMTLLLVPVAEGAPAELSQDFIRRVRAVAGRWTS